MATLLNTLYPPLVDTFMPAFPNQQEAVINFSISPYNSYAEITYLHVTLVDQKTNKNVFRDSISNIPSLSSNHPLRKTSLVNGVWIIPFSETMPTEQTNPYLDLDRDANYYTLRIPPILLKDSSNEKTGNSSGTSADNLTDSSSVVFQVDHYYKVQLRFDKYNDEDRTSKFVTNGFLQSDYLVNNRAYFSEWSSVCLIKAIPTISVHLNNFTIEWSDYLRNNNLSITNLPSTTIQPQRVPNYVPGIVPFAGNLTFEGEGYDNTGLDKKTKSEYYQRNKWTSDIKTTSNNEYLMSYRMIVRNEKEEILKDSGVIYPAKEEKTNSFYWLCDLTNEETGVTYNLEIIFVTNNQYTFSKIFEFTLLDPIIKFNPVFSFNKIELPYNGQGYAWKRDDSEDFKDVDQEYLASLKSEIRADGHVWYEDENEKVLVTSEDGWVTITVTNSGLISPGFLFIKRATSLDDFQNWELLDCFYVEDGENVVRSITDKTVGSLVRYKYSCQYMTAKGNWTATVKSPEIVYPDFHDILLSRGDRQLAIRYNPQITSMTPVVNRVKIDTLGGKYPRFAENARLHYKQFQLSGLIIAESDYNRKFLNDLDYAEDMAIYDERMNGAYAIRNDTVKDTGTLTVYDEELEEEVTYYNGTYSNDIDKADTYIRKRKRDTQKNTYHDLYPMDNWWWERKFREDAMEWLNDGEPKLYRSMTEGNLIVMLDGITLTPNVQLGRRVWNFSCTVYEIGDGNSLQELDALGIFPVLNTYGLKYDLDYDINTNTTISRRQLGQTFHIFASESNRTPMVTASDLARGQIEISNSLNQTLKADFPTIGERVGSLYQGLYENYKFDSSSVRLIDLKVQFESLPQWYNLDSLTPEDADMGSLKFTIEQEDTSTTLNVEVVEGIRNGKKVAIIKEITTNSGNPWRNMTGKEFTDFLSDWEDSQSKIDPDTGNITGRGNNLYKINLDSGEDNYWEGEIGGKSHDKTIDAYVMEEIENRKKNKNNYGLGYKLRLNLVSPYDASQQLVRTIFVNQKGYYQVPSNMVVKEICLFDGAAATLDYILEYDLRYNDETEPNSYEIAENIVGQISGEWDWGTSIDPYIDKKYDSYEESESGLKTRQMVDYWKAISFDGTPYAILNIQSTKDLRTERYIVGRTGVLNLETDFPTQNLYINGRRMVQAPLSRQDYLDEWEYVLDPSVYENDDEGASGDERWYIVYNIEDGIDWSKWTNKKNPTDTVPTTPFVKVYLSEEYSEEDARDVFENWYALGGDNIYSSAEILEPKPNTIYGITNAQGYKEHMIYYLDWGWFPVEFPNLADSDYSICYARVPVYGMIEYRASILKKMWEPAFSTTTSASIPSEIEDSNG